MTRADRPNQRGAVLAAALVLCLAGALPASTAHAHAGSPGRPLADRPAGAGTSPPSTGVLPLGSTWL